MVKHYTNDEILKFLRDYPVMNIAAIYEGRPISSVLLFAVDDNFTFFFGTKMNTYKSMALENLPKISLSVWQHHKMMVQADGIVRRIAPEYQEEVLKKITNSTKNIEEFWPPILHTEGDQYVLYSIMPHWLRVMDLTSITISEKEVPFQMIINA